MKKTSKILAVLLALCLTLGLAGCGEKTQQSDVHYTIGIMQLMEHDALNLAQQGFVDRLAERGYTDGDKVTLLIENGQGDQNNLVTIADKFVSENVDLAFCIATPSTQAMASKTTTIPIVATAVTPSPTRLTCCCSCAQTCKLSASFIPLPRTTPPCNAVLPRIIWKTKTLKPWSAPSPTPTIFSRL